MPASDPPETIAAIASATAPAGVGVVRVSGADAIAVAARAIRARAPLADLPHAALRRAEIIDPSTGESVDDGLVAVFRAPNSFTGETVVEWQGHGGAVTLGRVLSALLASGARLARPGEFSERAFLNGKLDLAQAEAVASLIGAQTVSAQRVARRQLSGSLSRAVTAAGDRVAVALAHIEASIDFPEDVGELAGNPSALAAVASALADARAIAERLLATAAAGERLMSGVTLVLAGRPNVGKSSLLNALAGWDRAIVSPIAGTTRDVVEEALNIGGIPVRALDTAGIRETTDAVEVIGVERAKAAVASADVVVAVLDAGAGVTDADAAFLASLAGRLVVVAANKADSGGAGETLQLARHALPDAPGVAVAAITGAGLTELRAALGTLLGGDGLTDGDAPVVTAARHADALRRAAESLARASETLAAELPAELIAVDAHAALSALGEITGATAREEIIAGIFARFCIGK